MDLKDIFALIKKFDESSLSEIKIKNNEESISLRKGGDIQYAPPVMYGHPGVHPEHYQAPHQPSASAPAPQSEVGTAKPSESETAASSGNEVITAPIVGTFYRSPAPDSPAFADEGTKLSAGDTICIIEAMKQMNQLEIDFDLEVVKILVENGQMVEYGAPLFEVRRV
jgi:acetyl-CoA carboxylase biotin carboxyl carrier protein